MPHEQQDILSLGDYARVLRTRWRWVAGVVLVALSVGLVLSLVKEDRTAATGELALPGGPVATEPSAIELVLYEANDVSSHVQRLTARPLVTVVFEANGLTSTPDAVADFIDERLTVEERGTSSLEVTVVDAAPERARALAQGLMEAYVAREVSAARARLDEALQELQTQVEVTRLRVEALDQRAATASPALARSLELERDQLFAQARALAAESVELRLGAELGRRVQVASPAVALSSSRWASILSAAVLSAMGGLLLGIALAFLRHFTDTKHFDEQVLTALGAGPLLAKDVPPAVDSLPAISRPQGAAAHGHRQLRAAILATGRRTGSGSVLAWADLTRCGCAHLIAADVAVLAARSGQAVTLVDADVEGRRMSRLLHAAGPGLGDVLDSGAALRGRPHVEGLLVDVAAGTKLLPAGGSSRASLDALEGIGFHRLLRSLQDAEALTMLVPSPSSEGFSPWQVCAQADQTILVVEAGRTTHAEVRSSVEALRGTGTSVLGTVLIGRARRRRAADRTDGPRHPEASAGGLSRTAASEAPPAAAPRVPHA